MKEIDISHSSLSFKHIYFREDFETPTEEKVPQIKKYNIYNDFQLHYSTYSFIADWKLTEIKLYECRSYL